MDLVTLLFVLVKGMALSSIEVGGCGLAIVVLILVSERTIGESTIIVALAIGAGRGALTAPTFSRHDYLQTS